MGFFLHFPLNMLKILLNLQNKTVDKNGNFAIIGVTKR